MIVNSKAKLKEAATGVPAPPEPSPLDSTLGTALLSRIQPTATYGDWAKSQGLGAGVPVTGMGLSSKGKYGGYYTSTDLETAITGEAMARNAEANAYAQNMRDLAAKRQEQVQQTLTSQLRGLGNVPSGDRMAHQTASASPQAKELYDWATGRQGALDQTVQTASQIESTPVSDYARAIATQRYGMNPALAAGTFGPAYDAKMYEALNDQAYMQEYGMPYSAYKEQKATDEAALGKKLAQEKLARDEMDRQRLAYTSAAIGADATKLASASGLTPEQIYDTTSKEHVLGYVDKNDKPIETIPGEPIPAGAIPVKATFGQLAATALSDIQNGDYESARQTASSLLYSPGTETLGRLLSGYVNQLLALIGKTTTGLQKQSDVATYGGIASTSPGAQITGIVP